jgi:hypothetical protein
MLSKRTLRAAAAPLLVALAMTNCAFPELGVDKKLAADLSYIKIIKSPEGKCQYLGEKASYRILATYTHDVMDTQGAVQKKQEFELRQHAQRLGANVIASAMSVDTGYAYLFEIHTFHAC